MAFLLLALVGCGKYKQNIPIDTTSEAPNDRKVTESNINSKEMRTSGVKNEGKDKDYNSKEVTKNSKSNPTRLLKREECEKMAWVEISNRKMDPAKYLINSTVDKGTAYLFYFETIQEIKIPGQNFMVSVEKTSGSVRLVRGD
jgi:hypothetical protein